MWPFYLILYITSKFNSYNISKKPSGLFSFLSETISITLGLKKPTTSNALAVVSTSVFVTGLVRSFPTYLRPDLYYRPY
jgi:hypothetical protein